MSPANINLVSAGQKALSRKKTNSKQAPGIKRTSSSDSLDHFIQPVLRNSLQSRPATASRLTKTTTQAAVADNNRNISRIELLLAPKRPEQLYTPVEDTTTSQEVNRAIKLSAQWTDVQSAILQAPKLSATNVAFAVYRLGCLQAFASRKRNEELATSGLVKMLLEAASARVTDMDAGSATLLFDGCARLHAKPPQEMLRKLSDIVGSLAATLEASQLPIVLWASQALNFVPRSTVLSALDKAVDRLACAMSPQGITLTLQGFNAADHRPSTRTLDRLVETMQCQFSFFRPSELATCLEAFAAFGYKPPATLLKAVAQQTGQSLHSNIVVGKRCLSTQSEYTRAQPQAEGLLKVHAKYVAQEASKLAPRGIAAAGRVLEQVGAKVGELDSALANPKTAAPVAPGGTIPQL